jgi:hypothetical protein
VSIDPLDWRGARKASDVIANALFWAVGAALCGFCIE